MSGEERNMHLGRVMQGFSKVLVLDFSSMLGMWVIVYYSSNSA